jgi:hypothetical protein
METAKPPEIMLVYKNWNFFLTYPTELTNKGFALLLTFSFAPILFRLSILLNAFLGRRSYDNAIIIAKI